jgi:hypothetical protein
MSPQTGCLLINEIAPRMRATARCLPKVGADDVEEVYQDGLAIAAKMLDNAEQNGKEVTAGNIVWHASKQLATGRRSTYAGRTDTMAPSTMLDGNSRIASLHGEVVSDQEPGGGVESTPLTDLLVDTVEDPAMAAARNIDWAEFLSGLDALSRKMVVAFAHGDTARSLKNEAGLSDSGMSSRKRQLIAKMREVLGPDCLADAGRQPDWRADITAQQEKDACRHEMGVA